MVTLYVPAIKPLMSFEVLPFDHIYMYGEVPPVTLSVIAPLLPA